MCIVINSAYPAQPDGSIRFKLMKVWPSGRVTGTNYMDNIPHKVGDVRKAEPVPCYFGEDNPKNPQKYGIHVCADEESFEKLLRRYRQGCFTDLAKVKVECRGFLAGGSFSDEPNGEVLNETWQEVTILSIEALPDETESD